MTFIARGGTTPSCTHSHFPEQTGNYVGRAVEITALRHRVEMGATNHKRLIRLLAPKFDN